MAITAGMFVWKVYETNTAYAPVPQAFQAPKKGNVVCTQEAKACPDGSYVSRTGPNCEFALCPEENDSAKPLNMANPASVFCEKNGGKLEIRTDEDGGQVGYCIFSDGSECEEWQYQRGECKPGNDQEKIDISDWQTYRNERYGFEFKYPKKLVNYGDYNFEVYDNGYGFYSVDNKIKTHEINLGSRPSDLLIFM